jgi:hypothetical protein
MRLLLLYQHKMQHLWAVLERQQQAAEARHLQWGED